MEFMNKMYMDTHDVKAVVKGEGVLRRRRQPSITDGKPAATSQEVAGCGIAGAFVKRSIQVWLMFAKTYAHILPNCITV